MKVRKRAIVFGLLFSKLCLFTEYIQMQIFLFVKKFIVKDFAKFDSLYFAEDAEDNNAEIIIKTKSPKK